MKKMQEEQITIEVFENDLQLYLQLFCEENNIDDMRKQSQAVWNSALRYIYKHVFQGTNKLKSKDLIYNINNNIPTNYNAYNYKLVLDILYVYAYDMCMRYDKEVSILGFSVLTGIDTEVIHNWGRESNKSSSLSSDIYKKLRDLREESLSNKLATGKQNPVGVLAILNRHYSWNMPGVSKETTVKTALPASELPKLGTVEAPKIEDNS